MTHPTNDPRPDSDTFKNYLRVVTQINEHEHRQDNPCSFFYKGLDRLTYIMCIAEGGIFQILPVDGDGAIGPPVEQPPNFWVPPTVDIRDWVGNGSQEAINTNIGFHREFRQNANNELRANTNLLFGPLAYDGTDLFLRLLWSIENTPSGGDDVQWELDFAYIKANVGENANTKVSGNLTKLVDVSSFTVDELVTTDLPVMAGLDAAALLEMNLRRDGFVDNYNKTVHLYATVLFRADTVL